jgi:poly(A) polymerase
MTAGADTSSTGLPSLAGAPWLVRPSTRTVLAALEAAGHEGRAVGGCVRNTLMKLPVSDIDIATTAAPEIVISACARAGLATVPTGLDHGTVTVIADRTTIEVTTLRRDIETDGRHATVAFTEEWAEDAKRRDFTMNALYCDAQGRLYDFVGGYADLVGRRVRFIGDADRRIAEDYLRILRFFRFHATYAAGAPDPVAMAACARGIAGIGRLSAERIRAELVKLLVAPRAVAAVHAMGDIGLLPVLLGIAPRPHVMEQLVAAETATGVTPVAMLRLSGLAVAVAEDIPRLADRLRLSGEERRSLFVIDLQALATLGVIDPPRARAIIYRKGATTSRQWALALMAIAPERKPEADLLRRTAAEWQPPRLPISGADLVARGMRPGPAMGKLLTELESWWTTEDFPDEKAAIEKLETLLASRKAE